MTAFTSSGVVPELQSVALSVLSCPFDKRPTVHGIVSDINIRIASRNYREVVPYTMGLACYDQQFTGYREFPIFAWEESVRSYGAPDSRLSLKQWLTTDYR